MVGHHPPCCLLIHSVKLVSPQVLLSRLGPTSSVYPLSFVAQLITPIQPLFGSDNHPFPLPCESVSLPTESAKKSSCVSQASVVSRPINVPYRVLVINDQLLRTCLNMGFLSLRLLLLSARPFSLI